MDWGYDTPFLLPSQLRLGVIEDDYFRMNQRKREPRRDNNQHAQENGYKNHIQLTFANDRENISHNFS